FLYPRLLFTTHRAPPYLHSFPTRRSSDLLRGHAEQTRLRLVRVRDDALCEVCRRAGDFGQTVRDESARAAFGDGEREAADGEAESDNLLHRLAAEGEYGVAESVFDLSRQSVEQKLGLLLGL